jgi:hypothetical protein
MEINMGRKEKNSGYANLVKDKKLPILTLDNRWHELFTEEQKTPEIRELEQKVNNLLKRQGKLVNDIKDMKKLKSNLLNDIVENMDIGLDMQGKAKEKKLDKNKQYINELNSKLEKKIEDIFHKHFIPHILYKKFSYQSEFDKVDKRKRYICDWLVTINGIDCIIELFGYYGKKYKKYD